MIIEIHEVCLADVLLERADRDTSELGQRAKVHWMLWRPAEVAQIFPTTVRYVMRHAPAP